VSRKTALRELEVEAAGLIRAALTGDEFTMDRIVTHAYEDNLDWRSFANEVTYTAAVLRIVASGSKAQATTLLDTWLDSLVRKRMAAASLRTSRLARYAVPEPQAAGVLQLHLEVGGSLGCRGGVRFGLGFGLPADTRGVCAAGEPGGLVLVELPGRVFNLRDRLGDTRVRVMSLGWFCARLSFWHGFEVGSGLWLTFGWPGLPCVDGGLALALDRPLDGGHVGLQLAHPFRARV
jgi:hypothetical protein